MNRLQALRDAGVSIWLDTLSRDLLDSGEFGRLIDESAVTGATSNPTIFAKAITGSERYDEQLRAAAAPTDSSPSSARRTSPTTPRPRSRRRSTSGSA